MGKNLLLNEQVYLYGDVGNPFGWGDGFTAMDVANALADHGPGDVTVRINSGGGIAFEGMTIYSLLRAHEGKVTMIVDGIAASAASLIAMAGDDRQMRDGAMLMIHDAAAVTFGPASSHRKNADDLEKLSDNYAGVYAARAGLDKKEVRALMLATTYMTADEAIAKGFATAKAEDKAMALAAFDYRVYCRDGAEVPRFLPIRQSKDAAPDLAPAPTASTASLAIAASARMRMRSRAF